MMPAIAPLRLRLLCCSRRNKPVALRPGADPAAETGLGALRGHRRHGDGREAAI